MLPIRVAAFLLVCGACFPKAPAPAAPRTALSVAASFSRTWDAVVDAFAERSIPIKTIDRSSGLIVADEMALPGPSIDRIKYADCGSDGMGTRFVASRAGYNVLVRGDSARSTVKVTARFVSVNAVNAKSADCSTTGLLESAIEGQVKERAELPGTP